MRRKVAFDLRELDVLHKDVRGLFALTLVLSACLISYMAVRVHLLPIRMTRIDFASLCFFAFASFVLCQAQLRCLRQMRGMARARLRGLMFVDELTGAYNYRYLKQRLEDEVDHARRSRRPLAIIYLDIDNFKALNDTLGHQAGNAGLKRIAQALVASIRRDGFVARHGGDEFVVVLPEADREGATAAVRRIAAQLDGLGLRIGDGEEAEPLTFSMGFATCPGDAESQEGLLRVADEAMYRDKQQGHRPVLSEVAPAPAERATGSAARA
jgi:diguanylate cyclase (GGDEF)-like protein